MFVAEGATGAKALRLVRRAVRTCYWCLLEARPAVVGIFLLRFLAGASFAGPLLAGGANLPLWGGAALWVCVTLSVYVLNGVMDVEEDRINGSSRPVASGKLEVARAAGVAAGLGALSVAGGFLLGWLMACSAVATLVLGWLYSGPPFYLKRRPAGWAVLGVAAALITYNAGFASNGAGADGSGGDLSSFVVFASVMALWLGVVSQTKDLSDAEGDRRAGRRSVPVVFGEWRPASCSPARRCASGARTSWRPHSSRRLAAMGSPLLQEEQTREQVLGQARAVLGEVVRSLRRGGETDGYGARRGEGDRLPEEIGACRAGASVHPAESLRAVVAFSEAALSVLVDHLPPPRDLLGGEVAAVAVAIQGVFMGRVTRAAVAYAGYLLEKAHESHADERRRIGRELHDRVAHSIMVVFRNLELFELYAEKNPQKAKEKLGLAKQTAQEAMRTARDLSSELRNSGAEDGLEAALSGYLRAFSPPCVEARVSAEGDESLLAPEVRDQLFLVLREAARNAIAHSGARNILVELSAEEGRFEASVEDDGRGFEPAEAAAREAGRGATQRGTGLDSMRERASLLGGTLSVTSPPGGGTRVEILVPLPGRRQGGYPGARA